MIRCIIFIAFFVTVHPAIAQTPGRTDPLQYEARMTAEAQKYLSDCSIAENISTIKIDCRGLQAEFGSVYYEAFEGNVSDQYLLGFWFAHGIEYGVKPNPVLACAWWIVTDNSGGPLPVNPAASALASLCREVPEAVAASDALEDEMTKVENLTY